jgi:DNA-binding Lrp family transcriptional regulator
MSNEMVEMQKIPKLDLKDKRICYELDINARQSLQQISKKVGLSKQVISYRIKSLMEKGVIKGFYTILDVHKLGFIAFKVYLKVQVFSPKIEKDFISYLTKNKMVAWVVMSDGYWDYNIVYLCRNINEFNKAYEEFIDKFRDVIEEEEISIVTEAYQFRRSYILGEKDDDTKFDVMNSPEPPKWEGDKTDWEILKIIAPNARAELQEIGEKVNLSPKAVSLRIKNLVSKGVIQSFRAQFDISSLGFKYYKVFLRVKNFNKEAQKRMWTWLRYHPNIIYTTKAIGKADFEFEMQARGREEFHKVLDQFREEFGEYVRTVESLHYFKEFKFLYMPEATPE